MAVPAEVMRARHLAECLVEPAVVQQGIDRLSIRLTLRLEHANPLLLVVMHGGLPFAAELLRRFAFPVEYGYLHVGRYGTGTTGGALTWRAEPAYDLTGRTVLIVDDILDRGDTLLALTEWAGAAGAREVLTAVLVDKQVETPRPIGADFAAFACPDRYLFGCGMDFRGYWRNLPGIYALPEDLADA